MNPMDLPPTELARRLERLEKEMRIENRAYRVHLVSMVERAQAALNSAIRDLKYHDLTYNEEGARADSKMLRL